MPLKVAKFKFAFQPLEKILLPRYKGSTFRGGFGHAFKGVVCALRQQECTQCIMRLSCVYSYVFETPLSKPSTVLKKYPYAPHPFVIEPPFETQSVYLPSDTLSFNLILIGRAIDYLPYFIYTFDELGKRGIGRGRGKYQLRSVHSLAADGSETLIYDGAEKKIFNTYAVITERELVSLNTETESLHMSFLTPTRLKYQGKLTLDLSFGILMRNLLRRLSTLSFYHCEEELDVDYRGLVSRADRITLVNSALKWYDWERYSNRQETKLKMGGFVGEISFTGQLGEFMPYLKMGELLHVGKGTSFGLGRYKIVNV